MSTRVEEDARKAAEAERLQQKIDREARNQKAGQANREAFSKLVKSGQQSSSQAKATTQKAEAEAHRDEAAGEKAKQAAVGEQKSAQAARGGIRQQTKAMAQAKSFQGVLANQTQSTKQADGTRVERRDEGSKSDRVERDDRKTDLKKADDKRDVEADLARVEAREQQRPNAAIDGDTSGDPGSGDGGRDPGAAAIGGMKAAALQAQAAQAAHEVKQIPPELMDKLVSAVWLGVNEKGLKEFQIELKDGPLKGASVRISADDGKIALRFDGLDGNTKRLVEASKGELMRRLSSKGLSLSKLDVR